MNADFPADLIAGECVSCNFGGKHGPSGCSLIKIYSPAMQKKKEKRKFPKVYVYCAFDFILHGCIFWWRTAGQPGLAFTHAHTGEAGSFQVEIHAHFY